MGNKIEKQGKISLEDEFDMNGEGRMAQVEVSEDSGTIKIGQYVISAEHFSIFASYLAGGGFMGWLDFQVPEFAESALNAMKQSKNPLYKAIQQELK